MPKQSDQALSAVQRILHLRAKCDGEIVAAHDRCKKRIAETLSALSDRDRKRAEDALSALGKKV